VIDISETRDQLYVFINPELASLEGEAESEEGCLSVPGYYELVTRAAKVTVRALNERGDPFELTTEGRLAVCIQHEMDHLLGKVFVDYLSPLKRARLAAKFRKKQRLAG
jgi:peptide deformylase